MEKGLIKILRLRFLPQSFKSLSSVRSYSNVPDQKKNFKQQVAVSSIYPKLVPEFWSERAAAKKTVKEHSFPLSIKTSADYLQFLQSLRNLPVNLTELFEFIKYRRHRKNLLKQKFIHERELVLKPDLAAAHFIIYRGGSIKFLGQSSWVGCREEKKSLPFCYIPGYHVEGIKAENTELCYEGLENIRKLKYLNYLSLKGLEEVNDWFLDWISKEYYASLRHLDLSDCKNVTYRGLSCFYRFEQLKTLNLEGVPDTAELKLACLMLLEVQPHLDITGINLDIPDKIEAVNPEETKFVPEETKLISEKTGNISEESKLLAEEANDISKNSKQVFKI